MKKNNVLKNGLAAVFANKPVVDKNNEPVDTRPRKTKQNRDQIQAQAAEKISPKIVPTKAETEPLPIAKSKKTSPKKPGAAPEGKSKVTYYIDSTTVKNLKYLSIEMGRDYSDLADEAIRTFVKKHAKKCQIPGIA